MRANMGTIDRIIRFLVAAAVGILIFAGKLDGLAAVLMAMGAIALVTSGLLGFCPAYAPFKLSTRRRF